MGDVCGTLRPDVILIANGEGGDRVFTDVLEEFEGALVSEPTPLLFIIGTYLLRQ